MIRNRTVAEALENQPCVRDIQGPFYVEGLLQYLQSLECPGNIDLQQEVGQHVWKHETSGSFTSKSTYSAFFYGSLTFEPWKHLWKSWAPSKCKIFSWLAIRILEQMLDSQSTAPSVP